MKELKDFDDLISIVPNVANELFKFFKQHIPVDQYRISHKSTTITLIFLAEDPIVDMDKYIGVTSI